MDSIRFPRKNFLVGGATLLGAALIGAAGCGGGGASDGSEYGASIESAFFSPTNANGLFPEGGKWAAAGQPAGRVEGGVVFEEGSTVDAATVKLAVLDDDGTIIAGPVVMVYSNEAYRGTLDIPNNPSGSQRTLTIGMSAKDPSGREIFEDGEIGTFVQLGGAVG